ncbi:MAG: hypothetical protein ABJG68_07165 [Crocinitomicaceae bacterium]
MKNLKSLLIAVCLFAGFNSISQEVKNTTTDIIYKGSVYHLDKSLTHVTEWIDEDSHMMDLMALTTTVHSAEDSKIWGLQKEQVKDGDLILGIPFLSCGIGYDYYKLIQEDDNFLLFEMIGARGDFERKVIVLNKRK